MKIVAPVSRLDEVAVLASAGANELYCGLALPEWQGRFQAASANRRPSANFRSYVELSAAIEIAHQHGAALSLVLNAQHYSAQQLEAAAVMADRFTELGGDALIVSDLGLLQMLAVRVPGLRLHVSSVATCRNASAAQLCQELGAHRLILPRDVTIDEAVGIARALPELEIEAFILNDACIFEEGACHTIHLPGQLGGPICLDRYRYRYQRRGGAEVSSRLQARLDDNDAAYEKWLWYRFSCGFSTTTDGKPFGPCGLCALPAFRRGRVAAVKIAGREAPTARKLASVQMVKAVVERSLVDTDPAAVQDFATRLRPSVAQCASGNMCYYPEVVTGTGA